MNAEPPTFDMLSLPLVHIYSASGTYIGRAVQIPQAFVSENSPKCVFAMINTVFHKIQRQRQHVKSGGARRS